jgi:hypothetical protein
MAYMLRFIPITVQFNTQRGTGTAMCGKKSNKSLKISIPAV